MRTIGRAVEEQVGQRIARKVIGIVHLVGEDDALGANALLVRRFANAVVGLINRL